MLLVCSLIKTADLQTAVASSKCRSPRAETSANVLMMMIESAVCELVLVLVPMLVLLMLVVDTGGDTAASKGTEKRRG